MIRFLSLAAAAFLMVVALLLIGSGCSTDSALSPTGGDLSQTVLSSAAGEPTFVETFDKGSNVGGWSFFGDPHNRIEVIEPQDGNPGAFLHATCGKFGCLDSAAPLLRTLIGESSIFVGNYRERGVTKIGVDIAIFGAANTGWRPLSPMLRNDGGTPYDYSDDIWVFYLGNKMIPMPNGVFKEYEFFVPSQSTTLPKGWKVLGGYGTGDDNADWNTVINDVSEVAFHFGDPEMFFMFQLWEIGVDNVRVWYDE